MTELEKLKLLTGEGNQELLSLLYEDAESFVLSYTNRTRLIGKLQKPTRDLAVIYYNRLGTEGEMKRTEAGESYEFNDLPKHITEVLNRYRLARCGGRAYEKKQD